MAMFSNQDPEQQAKWTKEWEEAVERKRIAETSPTYFATIFSSINAELITARKTINDLSLTADHERTLRKDAEKSEAAVRAAYSSSPEASQYDNLVQESEQCCGQGEERLSEIRGLRKKLQDAKHTPGPPNLEAGDGPFTKGEARALCTLIGDYITQSQQYREIVQTLEQQMNGLKEVKDQQKQWEVEKADLQGQIELLVRDENDEITRNNEEIIHLTAQLAHRKEALDANPNGQVRVLQEQLAVAESEISEHERVAARIVDDIADLPDIVPTFGGEEKLSQTLESAVACLHKRCAEFEHQVQTERRAMDSQINTATPQFEALKKAHRRANEEIERLQVELEELKGDCTEQNNEVWRLTKKLRDLGEGKENGGGPSDSIEEDLDEALLNLTEATNGWNGEVNKNKELQDQLADAVQELEDYRSGKSSGSDFKQAIRTLKEENTWLLQRIKRLEDDVDTSNETIGVQIRLLEDLEKQVNEQTDALNKIPTELKSCMKERAAAKPKPAENLGDETPVSVLAFPEHHLDAPPTKFSPLNDADLSSYVPASPYIDEAIALDHNTDLNQYTSISSESAQHADLESGYLQCTPPSFSAETHPPLPPRPVPKIPIQHQLAPTASRQPTRSTRAHPRAPSPSPSITSSDTPTDTPGGTKRKRTPGSRVRAETRANKRREIELWKNPIIEAPNEPTTPLVVEAPIVARKEEGEKKRVVKSSKPVKKPVKKGATKSSKARKLSPKQSGGK